MSELTRVVVDKELENKRLAAYGNPLLTKVFTRVRDLTTITVITLGLILKYIERYLHACKYVHMHVHMYCHII